MTRERRSPLAQGTLSVRRRSFCEELLKPPTGELTAQPRRSRHPLVRPRVKLVVFLWPGIEKNDLPEYYDLDAPILRLDAEGFPDEYRYIHPPAPVLAWYGAEIMKALKELSLVPPPGG